MPKDYVHDPDLLDALEALQATPFNRDVWRVTWARRNPLTGGTGGGRWHPPNDFEALYTSFEKNGALAEIYHHLSKAPIMSSSYVRLNRLEVRTERTLVMSDFEVLTPLGVVEARFRRGDHARTREIGAAARFLDFDALAVPSARWPCANLVIFLDRLPNPESLRAMESQDVNWPAWRETIRATPTAPRTPNR